VQKEKNGCEKESEEVFEKVEEVFQEADLASRNPAGRRDFCWKRRGGNTRLEKAVFGLHFFSKIPYTIKTMQIEISAKNLDLTPSLEAYFRDKLGYFSKFVERYEDLGEVEAKGVIERVSAHHNKGEIFRAAADIVLPKKNLHAEDMNEDAHAAIDAVKNKLHHEIEKYRGEHDNI
jgi:ribosomal subunit interface protein